MRFVRTGVMLLLFRPFQVGDYIEAGGTGGSVESIGLFTTRSTQDAGDVWIASGSELARWWLSRSHLDLHVGALEDGSVTLTVRNQGIAAVSSAWLRVYLPENGEAYAAPELGETIIESEYCPGGLRLRLPTVGPGESVDILLPRRSI